MGSGQLKWGSGFYSSCEGRTVGGKGRLDIVYVCLHDKWSQKCAMIGADDRMRKRM